MFTIVQHFSPQNTAKSDNSVFWFVALWARVSASCFGVGILVWVPGINGRVSRPLTRRSSTRPMAAGRLSAAAVLQR